MSLVIQFCIKRNLVHQDSLGQDHRLQVYNLLNYHSITFSPKRLMQIEAPFIHISLHVKAISPKFVFPNLKEKLGLVVH